MASILNRPIPHELVNAGQELTDLVQSVFWDNDDGFFYDRAVGQGAVRVKTAAGFMPLFAGAATVEQTEKMVIHLTNQNLFWGAFPIASTAFSESSYTKDYWRGPTWINYNYMIIQGLRRYGYTDIAKRLRETTLAEIARWYQHTGVLWELYDAEGTDCPGNFLKMGAMLAKRPRCLVSGAVKDFGWTAALFIHMMNEQ